MTPQLDAMRDPGASDHDLASAASALGRVIPFLVVAGYALAGKAESPRVHIEYCRDHGRLGSVPAAQPAFAAAAEALVASSAWRDVMADHGSAAAMIRAEAERATQR